MQPNKFSSPVPIQRPSRVNHWLCSFVATLLMLSSVPNIRAEDVTTKPQASTQSLAFARHIASFESPNPFDQPVVILIEAALPDLYKEAYLLAFRDHGSDGRGQYNILGVGGDGAVLSEVIGRFLVVQQQMDGIATSSMAITPSNYKFRFAGEVNTGETPAFIYRIAPKRSGAGLVSGHLWMDSQTGAEVMLTGRLRKLPALHGPAELVRETRFLNGAPQLRVTHVTFALRNLGRAELAISESPLRPRGEGRQAEPLSSAFLNRE